MDPYISADRFDEAKAIAQRGLAKDPKSPAFHELLWQIAFVQGDASAQTSEMNWLRTNDAGDADRLQGFADMVVGKMDEARQLYMCA